MCSSKRAMRNNFQAKLRVDYSIYFEHMEFFIEPQYYLIYMFYTEQKVNRHVKNYNLKFIGDFLSNSLGIYFPRKAAITIHISRINNVGNRKKFNSQYYSHFLISLVKNITTRAYWFKKTSSYLYLIRDCSNYIRRTVSESRIRCIAINKHLMKAR